MTMTSDNSIDLVVVAQTAITETLASQATILQDISQTLTNIAVDQAIMQERFASVLENNQRIEGTISGHGSRIRNLENKVSVHNFTQGFAPRMFFALISAFAVGGSVVYLALQIVSKGGV